MTDDLVKRLHESAQAWDNEGECGLATLEREAAYCIEDQQKRNAALKFILACALADYESSPYPQDMHFDWIEDARAALGEKKDG
jgi:hypothetical protein